MASIKEQFEIPGTLKTWAYALIGIGGAALLYGMFTKGFSTDEHEQAHFWGTLMYNTIFWTLVCNAAMFFICFSTMAQAAWMQSFRRIAEAISTLVPVFGTITFAVLMFVVLGHKHHIYHWLDHEAVMKDPILKGKVGFLNPTFFIVWTTLTITLWSYFGYRMRKISSEADVAPMDADTAKAYNIKSMVGAGFFLVWVGLTVASTIPGVWLMSIDAHWYSTMYSWYTFASSFVAGMSLVALWLIYMKNKGYMELSNSEHLHDMGKFMFAFSIFWTYLWFSQYMLIWYANIPEETVYFKHRVQGAYKPIFFLNLIVNFLAPLLILMKRSAKRNFTLMALMAVVILFGHWIDFYQMVMGSLMKEHVSLGWLDFGVLTFFVGVMILMTARALASKPLIAKYHPFLKESIIHHT
jgi:hypothetical protein